MNSIINKIVFSLILLTSNLAFSATLVGWSDMAKATYTAGPYSHHQPKNSWIPPSAHVIGGFSAGLIGSNGNPLFLSDTGYGPKASSMSYLLNIVEMSVHFEKKGFRNASVSKILYLSDEERRLSFPIQADFLHYGNEITNNKVDSLIKEKTLLTGGDIDPESIRVDYKGHIWVGEEFGPFLVKFDHRGRVMRKEIPIPGITSPDSPLLKPQQVPTIKTTAGLEGMAINPEGDKLYPMLEKAVIGDEQKTLRIYEFDVDKEVFESGYYLYKLDEHSTEIRELVAINEYEFLTIEQNEYNTQHKVKKVYWLSIEGVQKGQYVYKKELVDLLNIDDPNDLNMDGKTKFSFPKLTIETIVIQDEQNLIIVNDNNIGERTEYIQIQLDEPLHLQKFNSMQVDTSEWELRDKNYYIWRGFHTPMAWVIVFGYFFVFLMASLNLLAQKSNSRTFPYKWLSVTFLLFILFLYRHLIGRWYLTEYFRDVFIDLDLYQTRYGIQYLVVIAILVVTIAVFLLVSFLYKSKNAKYTLGAILLLLCFNAIQIISYHYVDIIFNISLYYGRMADLIEISLILVAFLALKSDIKIEKQKLV